MRHWGRRNYFTGHGIDIYKAKDTTRIFVKPVSVYDLNSEEHNLVRDNAAFSGNAIPGGGIQNISFKDIKEHFDLKKEVENYTWEDVDEAQYNHPNFFLVK